MPQRTPSNNLMEPNDTTASKPLIIPVFIPHSGCPHRCVFCNQHLISGMEMSFPAQTDIVETVRRFLHHSRLGRFPVEIAFFGGNFLGLPPRDIDHCIQAVLPFVQQGHVHGVRCSTRPDTINPQSLAQLSSYPFRIIEIGIQSMDDGVLKRSGRGHTSGDSERAVKLAREFGFQVGAQIMAGLPGSDAEKDRISAEKTAALGPDFVRIYPTLVLRGSPLAQWYDQGRYQPLTLEEAIERSGAMIGVFLDHGIPVIRIGLQPTDAMMRPGEILAGPFHPAFGHLVYAAMFRAMAQESLEAQSELPDPVRLFVHPQDQSRLRGNRNDNIRYLQRRFGISRVDVIPDSSVPRGLIRISPEKPRKALFYS